MQREYQKRLASLWGGTMPGVVPAAKKPEGESTEAAELKALRARLEELEKKVGKK
jgi:hypothetical protein